MAGAFEILAIVYLIRALVYFCKGNKAEAAKYLKAGIILAIAAVGIIALVLAIAPQRGTSNGLQT